LSQESLIRQIEEQIKEKVIAKETEIQEILRNARSRYITELQSNIQYHEHMARTLTDAGSHQSALQHSVLVEIYRSVLDRA
jgi:hypothetical protein